VAEITSNGSYELTTNGKPGAPCGFYKVVVAASSTESNGCHDVSLSTRFSGMLSVRLATE
jgi:hypothetical protein